MFIVASFSFFWNAVIGQFDVVTLKFLGTRFVHYGKIRAWGSVGFVLTVTLLGWILDIVGIDQLPVIMSLLLLFIWMSSLWAQEYSKPPQHEATQGLRQILSRPSVMAFLLACFLLQFSHGTYYTFYSIYLNAYEYSKSIMGLLWGSAIMAELVLFLLMAKFLRRFSLRAILLFSLSVSSLRWAIIGLFPEHLLALFIAQIGHAFTFASFHAVAVEWVRRSFGEHHQGQGQAIYGAISFGAGGAIGAMVSGVLWDDNQLLTWLFASAASVMGFLIVWFFVDIKKSNDKLAAV